MRNPDWVSRFLSKIKVTSQEKNWSRHWRAAESRFHPTRWKKCGRPSKHSAFHTKPRDHCRLTLLTTVFTPNTWWDKIHMVTVSLCFPTKQCQLLFVKDSRENYDTVIGRGLFNGLHNRTLASFCHPSYVQFQSAHRNGCSLILEKLGFFFFCL